MALRPDGPVGSRPQTAEYLGTEGRRALVAALAAKGWKSDAYVPAATPSLLDKLGSSPLTDGPDVYGGVVQVLRVGENVFLLFNWCKDTHCLSLSIYSSTSDPTSACEDVRINRFAEVTNLVIKGSPACAAVVVDTTVARENSTMVAWTEHSLVFVIRDDPGHLTIDQVVAVAREPMIRLSP